MTWRRSTGGWRCWRLSGHQSQQRDLVKRTKTKTHFSEHWQDDHDCYYRGSGSNRRSCLEELHMY
eukprot:665778-Pyramimonas_sp.AAC.1